MGFARKFANSLRALRSERAPPRKLAEASCYTNYNYVNICSNHVCLKAPLRNFILNMYIYIYDTDRLTHVVSGTRILGVHRTGNLLDVPNPAPKKA